MLNLNRLDYDDIGPIPCEVCEGLGKIEVNLAVNPTFFKDIVLMTCAECDGTGLYDPEW